MDTENKPDLSWKGPKKLTKMQIAVLREIAVYGHSSTTIAKRLYLSRRTVEFHLAGAYAILEVNNRTAAVIEANKHNLLDYSPEEAAALKG